ncbi:gap junction delta-4 protein-like [Cyclopterus lumpus]|uniref:gap junction delta-4 protein-like n=1 Tax=Cyclopterus lumpus TaxID=8103 RepID=UPI001485D8A5|nr:gap junction delta-4 protein-like [Cyclopterus lumpus]
MGARDLLFITMSHNVSFVGKTWWVLMLLLRLLVLLLAGSTLFGDEQERFICNTIQPGCSNVCFDVLAPVSVLRLWLVHLVLLCLPHALFATYVVHRVLPRSLRGGFTLEGSSESRQLHLHEAPCRDPPRERGAPRFYCAYFLVVLLRILLEVVFAAGQFFLFGLSIPKRFLCYEAPCMSGVECYVSRPTEKTVMLNFMLAVASLSVLLSLVDLASSVKAMVTWRRRREMSMEEMSKGEQNSMLTTTTATEDDDVHPGRRTGPGESPRNGLNEEERAAAVPNGDGLHAKVDANDARPDSKYATVETSRPPTRTCAPAPTHFVIHSHLRPPLCRLPDRAPGPRTPTPVGVQNQSESSESQDKRAWV